ncbi:MAG TPA: glycogen/starch synthase [Bacteroidia bacterium]|jgi:starch synthase|nr:glycogen/starch synthase [Bacteroidota bacterium]MBP9790682.1 glycogen/starch synthase [Bacteroidia bacterium]MBK7570813.1 glycogen/starch synthase [Bacteroidota bacterium]MBK8587475.1 glycogen/starch synthase [Bacteroidota bacterium]MBP9922867.1 glycogen/starch synthase [Bacteroidia bacterium]
MKKAKVLFISQEMTPFLELTEISKIARFLPQGIQEKGKEIRTFMPRFGMINERRNQLHEVIRLSGMNLIIDDSDHPLIIKVASIQSARMQVYFIDNDEYFQRKSIFRDAKKKFHKDNEDRMVFFCRGVLETVKKLGWAPDVIHCHGWMTSLIPFFIKTGYKDDPMFKNSRVVYSSYYQDLDDTMSPNLLKKLKMDGVTLEDSKLYKEPSMVNVNLAAMKLSDGVIKGCDGKNAILDAYLKKAGKPVLDYQNFEDESAFVAACSDFYDELLEQEPVLAE